MEYSPRRKGSAPVIRGDARSSLRAYRYQHSSGGSSQGDTVASENLEWDYSRQGAGGGGGGGHVHSPTSAGVGPAKHFKYPAYVGSTAAGGQRNSQHQAWKGSGGHHHRHHVTGATSNGTWNEEEEDEDNSGRVSTSLPTDAKADFSLYEEDEIEGSRVAAAARVPRRMSAQDVLQDSERRHVSRHKRLRHSTITSLTSLPDISGVREG